ncbi:hypothetical protein H7J06_19365 [Mycobacterium hodleri]|uniref:hypothetical protein n=1 Tax=Mycolicibacterium hodleri TaxID=49897 RepID=UPI0021F26660|nr:hypothetical protein [Mycolicibacterium hodleri]MCV7135144.1 hypothetical protein [Mycolicibacterium hodleri]
MTVALIALAPAVLWAGYFGWRMIDRRRYWDADRVEERRRHPKRAVGSSGSGLGDVSGLGSAAG